MPFQMTHLVIAKKILDLKPGFIKNIPQFYLGNLSPDSIHFRESSNPEHKNKYKKISHLYTGDEIWDEITNYDEWLDNVIAFAESHRSSEDIDFLYGHCAHVITDIRNKTRRWAPFVLKVHNFTALPESRNLFELDITKDYLTDEVNRDTHLYHTCVFRDEIWSYLALSKGINFHDIVMAGELEKIRDNILYNQFMNKPIINITENNFDTDEYMEFINDTTLFITEKLFP